MAVTPESETEQASTQPHRVDPSQPVLAAPKTYQRGINDGLRSWLKCQAIRNQESFSSQTECFLYTLADRGKYRSNKGRHSCRRSVCIYRALARAVSRMPEPGTITRWHPASAAVCD